MNNNCNINAISNDYLAKSLLIPMSDENSNFCFVALQVSTTNYSAVESIVFKKWKYFRA